ncbi:MAG: pyridoxal-phosphate dependent enzyme [Thermoleophilaceae bacterium]|nr:pyridoxal-phosphate dependent enzyme [Thermoleophilaceae bacterium]
MRLDVDRIHAAVEAIDPVFLDSPQYECGPLGGALGCAVTLKVETLNPVRCFKGRGTDTVMASLDGRAAVCASAGNLGQALAYSGARSGIAVTVMAGRTANPLKVERMRALGAEVRIVGEDIEDARAAAQRLAEEGGARLIEDSLDLATCEGAGTIGLELLAGGDRIDTLLIALGGGALAAGIGCVAKALAPGVEVVTVQPAGAPAMTLSWRRREVVETDSMDTIADGVAGRCPIPEVLDDLLEVVDDAVLVSEDAIKEGMRLLYLHAGLVVEPSAALGVAAILEDPERFAGRRVATIVCGSNVATADFERWVLSSSG